MKSVTESFHPFASQNLLYIENRSPAKRHASSPPVPARISICTFFASSGSFGISAIFISSSSFGCRLSLAASSSRAISFISGSLSLASMSFASLIPLRQAMYLLRASMMPPRSLYSLVSFTNRRWSAITAGSVISVVTSSYRASRPSSFCNMLFSSVIVVMVVVVNVLADGCDFRCHQ